MDFERASHIEIRMPRPVLDQMMQHALENRGEECCGLLGGRKGEIHSIYRLTNESPDPEREYQVALGLFQPFREMRGRDEELLAIYHSHPKSAAIPSQKDLRQNFYPLAVHFIISLAGFEPDIKGYRLAAETFEEIRWEIVDNF